MFILSLCHRRGLPRAACRGKVGDDTMMTYREDDTPSDHEAAAIRDVTAMNLMTSQGGKAP